MSVRKIRWFRVYDDLVDDPKVQRLPAELFRSLVNLWCLASENGGTLPDREHIGFKLRLLPAQVDKLLATLTAAGLLDQVDGWFAPHNWKARQFRSDADPTAAERAKRHRDAKRNVTRDAPVTSRPPESETDTETETEKKEDPAPSGAPVVDRKGKPYAFNDGGRIRLTQESLDLWKRAYKHIELEAELWALSEWANQQGDRWFKALAALLAKKNQQAADRREVAKHPPKIFWRSGMEGVT